MNLVRSICSASLNLRNKCFIKVRQPLQKVVVYVKDISLPDELVKNIKDEINVKQVEFVEVFNNVEYVEKQYL